VLNDVHGVTYTGRATKAAKVEEVGIKFVDLWAKAVGSTENVKRRASRRSSGSTACTQLLQCSTLDDDSRCTVP
jgi:hypothetical protein